MLRTARLAAVMAAAVMLPMVASAAETSFPFDSELILDVRPMKGSKKVPNLEIGPDGRATIELWCNSVTAQLVVVQQTVTVLTGEKTERQCPPDRLRGDDDMLSALQDVTTWRRDGDIVVFEGAKPMRFRVPTN